MPSQTHRHTDAVTDGHARTQSHTDTCRQGRVRMRANTHASPPTPTPALIHTHTFCTASSLKMVCRSLIASDTCEYVCVCECVCVCVCASYACMHVQTQTQRDRHRETDTERHTQGPFQFPDHGPASTSRHPPAPPFAAKQRAKKQKFQQKKSQCSSRHLDIFQRRHLLPNGEKEESLCTSSLTMHRHYRENFRAGAKVKQSNVTIEPLN